MLTIYCSTRDERLRKPWYQKLPRMDTVSGLTDAFWQNLTVFTTGLIVQMADIRALSQARILSRRAKSNSVAAKQSVQLMPLEILMSSILQGMGVGRNDDTQDLTGEEKKSTSSTGQEASKHWADDILFVRYSDVQITSTETAVGQPSQPKAICHAIIKVRKPSRFESLKGTIDEDVAYDAQLGQFSLRLAHEVGGPFVPTLISRVQAVDRFVNFIEAVDKAKGTITSEQATLRSIVFSYMAHDQPPDSKRWRVTLDLSGDSIDISLDDDNPHQLVIDLMRTLVNSAGGIGQLMAWLPRTLTAIEALEKIRSGWDDIESSGRGRIEFSMNNMDWMNIRYTLPKPAKKGQPSRKVLSLQAKLKIRRGETWWHLSRTEEVEDDFTSVLKPIWEGSGEDWRGFSTSAAGRPGKGLVAMLRSVDDTVKVMVPTVTPGMKNKIAGKTANSAVVLD